MKFQPGNNMRPPPGTSRRVFTEMLREMIMQDVGPKGFLGHPKKQTALQACCRSLINQASNGNIAALDLLMCRIDGKLMEFGAMIDAPQKTTENEQMTMQELARRIGFILLSQQPEESQLVSLN